jgi:hypothetical protein
MSRSILDSFKSVGSTALTGSRLIFKSNITPDIHIDLSQLLAEKPTQPETQTVSGSNPVAMSFIRPQIAITTGIGINKIIAPYGPPIKNAWLLAIVIFASSGLIGARLAWSACKRIPPKKKVIKTKR